MRVVRTARLIKHLEMFRELRILVFSILGALRSLGWCLIVLLVVLLMFSIFFTDSVIAHAANGDLSESQELRYYSIVWPVGRLRVGRGYPRNLGVASERLLKRF